MRAFRLEPLANAHLDEIYDFTSARWDEDQADRYIEALFEEFSAIADRRVLWRRIETAYDVAGFWRRWRSHVIYWKEADDGEIAIFAVLHQRMHQSARLREAIDGEP